MHVSGNTVIYCVMCESWRGAKYDAEPFADIFDVNLLRFSLSGRPPPVCRLPGEQVKQDSRGQTGWPRERFPH